MNSACLKFLFIAGIILLFTGCDVIKPPYQQSLITPVDEADTSVIVRKVLLEDFTGFYCGTCPPASEIATTLDSLYGNRLVIVGIHANFFADVSIHPVPYKEPDLRTPSGEEYYTFFGISSNPSGMVNRKAYGGSIILSKDAWGAAVTAELQAEPELGIRLKPEYTESNRTIKVEAEVRYLKPGTEYDKIVLMILESPIIAPQKDYRLPSPSNILNYSHKHVLRANINGTWGDLLSAGVSIPAGSQIAKSYTYTLPDHIDSEKVSIVAFVHRQLPDSQSDINRAVVQAEEVKLK